MVTKAEIGVMQLKAKDHHRLPANKQKLGRGEEGFFPGTVGGSTVPLTL